MARFAFHLLAVGAAAADTACPDGVCPADADEHSALLQHRASVAVNLSAGYLSWPPPSGATYCGASPAGTCGNPSIMCFRDTSGCSTSGGGSGCMAAGTSYPPAAGTSGSMNQCRFCGNGGSSPACPAAVNCCTANSLSCYSCQAGMSEAELCKSFPETSGCGQPPPTVCCLAFTAECLACQAGVSEDQYCTSSPAAARVPGCTSTGPQCPTPGPQAYMQDCESSYSNGYWYQCCQRGLWCSPTNPTAMGSRTTCQAIPASLAQVKVEKVTCEANGNVLCKGTTNSYCMGDQCCPGIKESGNLTYPCPSASDSYKDCANNTKLQTCSSSSLAQVKKHY